MRPNDARELLETLWDSEIRTPITFIGRKGVGKTAIVAQAVENRRKKYPQRNIGFFDIRLSLDTPEDIGGFPRVLDNERVEYLQTEWAHKASKYDEAIIFLDEINRAPLETRQALFEFLSKGTIRGKIVNHNYFIVAAMNPDNGNYQVEPLDPAFERRMIRIGIKGNHTDWIKWAKGNKVSTGVVRFLEANEKMLSEEEEFNIIVHRNEDAWKMLADIHEKVSDKLNRTSMMELYMGIVGKEPALAFQKFLESDSKPMLTEEFFKAYPESLKTLLSRNNDSITLTLQYISEFMAIKKNQTQKNLEIYVDLFRNGLPNEFAVMLYSAMSDEVIDQVAEYTKKAGLPPWWQDERFADKLSDIETAEETEVKKKKT